ERPGMQLEAARATPSGKVAIENGFAEVQIVAEPGYEAGATGHTGLGESRPVVRVRFSVGGTQFHAGAPGGAPGTPASVQKPISATAPKVPPIERPPVPARRIPAGVKVAIG